MSATVRAWALAFVPVAVFVALVTWGFLAIETATRADPGFAVTDDVPTDDVSVDDISAESLGPDDQPPAEDVTVANPELPDVEPIEQMPVRDGVSLNTYLQEGPDEVPVVADVAYLGTRDPYYAMALLSDTARVCLVLTVIPGADPNLTGLSKCSSWGEYLASGLVIDMGGWELRWSVDGGAEWIGI